MLFNSYPFIFLFLPLTFLGFFALARVSHAMAAAWLAAASLFFYGWWNPAYVGLLLASIAFNYTLGMWIARAPTGPGWGRRKRLFAFAVAANLLLLGYYKYTNFFLDNLAALSGAAPAHAEIILPLGISFFTFTQIAFLVDTWQGKVKEYNFVHYALFVTWFPHLIAGPILHHAEMMPQFGRAATYRPSAENVAAGLTIFVIGLFKKVILADGIAKYVGPLFDVAKGGTAPTFLEAWCGALAYALQLYFDFSGYSDMAIGLSLLFGVRLPLNFHSPYKAVSIIDFWRRWHMTLSRFLRDYLYFPLGGNRRGPARRYLNLMVTMLLGGLWHGASWTFVIWGGLHGFFLLVNHAFREARERLFGKAGPPTLAGRIAGGALTFLAVTVSWVFFRAESLDAALLMAKSMAGLNGLVLPDLWRGSWYGFGDWLAAQGVQFGDSRGLVRGGLLNSIALLLAVVWLAPNTQQIMSRFRPGLGMPEGEDYAGRLLWRPAPWLAVPVAALALTAIFNLHRKSEFLYFQF